MSEKHLTVQLPESVTEKLIIEEMTEERKGRKGWVDCPFSLQFLEEPCEPHYLIEYDRIEVEADGSLTFYGITFVERT